MIPATPYDSTVLSRYIATAHDLGNGARRSRAREVPHISRDLLHESCILEGLDTIPYQGGLNMVARSLLSDTDDTLAQTLVLPSTLQKRDVAFEIIVQVEVGGSCGRVGELNNCLIGSHGDEG